MSVVSVTHVMQRQVLGSAPAAARQCLAARPHLDACSAPNHPLRTGVSPSIPRGPAGLIVGHGPAGQPAPARTPGVGAGG